MRRLADSWLWQHYHTYQVPCWLGAGIAMVSFLNTRRLPRGPAPYPARLSAPGTPVQEEAVPVAAEG